MNATARWQEVIADNLAANQIPGYKKQDLSFSAVQAGVMGRTPGTTPASMRRFVMPLAGTSINFTPGELQPTNNPTDLAVDGPGFFEVQLPDGSHGFTRDGQFQINAQGQLTTNEGMPVMGETGPIQLDVNNTAPLTVAPTGEVSQGGILKGKLKIAEFDDPKLLTPTSNGYFVVTDPAVQPKAATQSQVRQGFLENANTASMSQMADLISAMRLFEANQKVIQTEDDRLGKLISEVGNAT